MGSIPNLARKRKDRVESLGSIVEAATEYV